MDDEPHAEPAEELNSVHADEEFVSEATIDGSQAGPYTGAFFPSSQDFIVNGGIFTSNTHVHQAPTLPAGFRVIPMGDIDLRNEIHLNKGSGVVGHRLGRGSARRIYSAKIYGAKSKMTVIVYDGKNAEEEWKRDVSRHTPLHHPNWIQIFATASSHGAYTTIIHDDLIPLDHFLNLYSHSHLSTMYFWAFCDSEWLKASDYFDSTFQTQRGINPSECTFWMRSSGRLCADLTPDDTSGRPSDNIPLASNESISLNRPMEDASIISLLTLEQYHNVCCYHLSQYMGRSIPAQTVKAGTVISLSTSTRLKRPVEIILLPELDISKVFDCWYSRGQKGEVMADGWSRYGSAEALNRVFTAAIGSLNVNSWLSQANYIFSLLQITSQHEDYIFMDLLYFNIIISVETQTPPAGYLFLCPPTHFKTGTNSFRWPAFPAYWSCDPSGVERLSTEEADNLGFPSISLNTTIWGRSWDASVYAGLRQFHQGKGFDPDSQDVARHLDQPLYQPFSVLDAPFSHGESECSDDEDSEVFIDEYFNELTEEECDSEEEDSDVPTDEAFVEPDYDSEEETSEVPAEEDVDESARVLVEQTVGDAEVWVHGLVLEV